MVPVILAAVVSVGCSPSEPSGQPAPAASAAGAAQAVTPVTPVVSLNAIMVDLVDHAGHNLWAVEGEGKAPKTSDDWDVVEEHAVQMVAAASVMTVGGTGPSDAVWVKTPSWRARSQTLMDAAHAAVQAAQAKDMNALVAANGKLVDACQQCHDEFKPTLPTEGIVHKHAH